jgi:hypothetical protein
MNVQRIITDEISIYTGKSNECHSCGSRNLDSGYPPAADSGMTGGLSRLPFDKLPGTTPGTGRTGKAAPTDSNLLSRAQ